MYLAIGSVTFQLTGMSIGSVLWLTTPSEHLWGLESLEEHGM